MAAEYKNVVLGLIFLKYISDSFQELYERLEQDEYSDPEDRDEYIAENCFFVPEIARWKSLQAKAKLPEIGVAIDDAMTVIEKENANGLLRQYFPKAMELLDVTVKEVIEAVHRLNERPRKCLKFKTPYEVFEANTGVNMKSAFEIALVT